MEERKIRVLVVDDEKIVREFFKRLLSVLGLETVDAENGYKAIELARNSRFDLCFIDMRMPGLNGLDTYRQIREINPQVMAVMITGYAVEEQLEQAKKEGAYRIIRKPFEINQIKDVINNFEMTKATGSLNVLVIDDDESVLSFFSNFLRGKNIRCRIAKNMVEALAEIGKEKFDLIFLDIVLKDINGVQIYQEIKEIFPEANVVLITGYPKKAEEVREKIEVTGCLYKPFDLENILKYIEEAKAKIQ